MPHEELVTKISTLRAHVQSLRENSESDEPMLDTIYDSYYLKGIGMEFIFRIPPKS